MSDCLQSVILLISCSFVTSLPAQDANERNWAQWRGPLATGVAPHADPPVEWNDDKNIRWKTPLPGRGHSTPIVWDDRIFVTTAIPFGEKLPPKYSGRPGEHDNHPVTHRYRFVVLAIDRADGSIVWEKNLNEDLPVEGGHFTASLASASPVTDGKHLFAFFGSFGLYCLDFDGNVVWKADLGKMHTKHGHGEGSSPVLHGDTLVVNWDHEDQSKLIAFDKRTGKVRWEVLRDEVTSWATPIVIEHDGRAQLIVSGTGRVRGYDLPTGKVIWECGGLSANIVASPVSADGMVFAGSSYEKTALIAIRLDGAEGDITGSPQVPWTLNTRTPYVPSPLLYGDSLYFLRHYQGILSRVNTKTGKDDGGPFRLGLIRDVYASPVAAADRIYVTDRWGTTIVMTHNAEPKHLSLNRLDDQINASAALVGSELFLRGEKFLY
ncbi:MAG TPA: PQQ-binding-like beta-propeller repeat protein, partial [Planctomycetaceae bacterium]|nr:PQQ-binding-like beta-propeller repeat protein [Planctomycetaceae bacterium]